ncbi:hypothetical protein FEM48_Zijuj06G0148600 [Ziziphus jujuba var. spinosa]|nr:hypothetical protein FEM48_Zijuj06G0148600 [Ziziphus jujuba var. spinosa]
MSKAQLSSLCLFVFLVAQLFHLSNGDVGTAARYTTPYIPTACGGNDPSQFPSNNMFGAAGEGVWDNGASCGRQYLVRCISASVPKTCKPGETIQIKIVDRAQTSVSRPSQDGTTIVLSTTAYDAIANGGTSSINIEFQE